MYLFFDTETTGLPRNWKAPITDFDNWPRLVQIAWTIHDENGNELEQADYIIKPNGFIIPLEVTKIHGISHEKAILEGIGLEIALKEFSIALEKNSFLIAHNMEFDEKIVSAEYLRSNLENSLSNIKKICTMKTSTDFCKLPGKYGNKWPTLPELHKILFGELFEEAHNAAVDVRACSRSFFALREKGIYG